MSIEIYIEYNCHIYIRKSFENYILKFLKDDSYENQFDTNEITLDSKDDLLTLLLNIYKDKFDTNEITIKLKTFDNIDLILKKFYSYIPAYTFTIPLLTILESINKNQINGLYKSVLIQETDNNITNTFPQEIVQEICSWLYFD